MSDAETSRPSSTEIVQWVVDIVAAYVSHNSVTATQIPDVIQTVFATLSGLRGGASAPAAGEALRPAVPVKKSITPEYLICLEDGKRMKMLKRHLRTTYGLTPEAYRVKWGLSPDYPMVAPNYAQQRSSFAKKIGLGRKPGGKGRRK